MTVDFVLDGVDESTPRAPGQSLQRGTPDEYVESQPVQPYRVTAPPRPADQFVLDPATERTLSLQNLKQAVSEIDPRKAADALEVARKSGIDPAIAMVDPESFKRELRATKDFESLQRAPATEAHLGSVDNMAVGQNEISTLSQTERLQQALAYMGASRARSVQAHDQAMKDFLDLPGKAADGIGYFHSFGGGLTEGLKASARGIASYGHEGGLKLQREARGALEGLGYSPAQVTDYLENGKALPKLAGGYAGELPWWLRTSAYRPEQGDMKPGGDVEVDILNAWGLPRMVYSLGKQLEKDNKVDLDPATLTGGLFKADEEWMRKVQAQGTSYKVVADVGQGVSSMATTLMFGLMGMPAVGLGVMGMQIAGGDMERARAEGADPDVAWRAGNWNALIQTPLEALSLAKAMKVWRPQGLLGVRFKDVFESMLTEGITEGIQTVPEKLSELYIKSNARDITEVKGFLENVFTAEFLKEAAYSGAIGALTAGIIGGPKLVHSAIFNRNRENPAHDPVNALAGQIDLMDATKSSDVAMRSFTQQLIDAKKLPEKVFVPAREVAALFQNEALPDRMDGVLEKMGVTTQEFADILARDGDISIEGSRLGPILADADSRLIANALLLNPVEREAVQRVDEIAQQMQVAGSDIVQATETTMDAAQAEKLFSTPLVENNLYREKLKADLVAAKIPAHKAEQVSALVDANAQIWAAIPGESIESYYRTFGYKIRRTNFGKLLQAAYAKHGQALGVATEGEFHDRYKRDQGFRDTVHGLLEFPADGQAQDAAQSVAHVKNPLVLGQVGDITIPAELQQAALAVTGNHENLQALTGQGVDAIKQTLLGLGYDGIRFTGPDGAERMVALTPAPAVRRAREGNFQAEAAHEVVNDADIPMSEDIVFAGADLNNPAQVAEAARLWQQMGTDSPYFKWWFGDSKVVDAQGKPLVVYHGTGRPGFTQFMRGQGGYVYFTPDAEYANRFAGTTGGVYPSYLSMKKPLDLTHFGDSGVGGLRLRDYLRDKLDIDLSGIEFNPSSVPVYNQVKHDELKWRLEEHGYDGIVLKESGNTAYLAFQPEQIKSATGNRGTFDAGDARILYQSAYHGSPYRFDKFTLDHIGSGEGAQAYGWGLYFAGDKQVAEWYREKLEDNAVRLTMKDGRIEIAMRTTTDGSNAGAFLAKHRGDFEAAIADAKLGGGFAAQEVRQLESWRDNAVKVEPTGQKGQLYEVTIPEADTMLDWDKPLSEQPEQVKKALGDEGGVYKKGMAFNSEAELRLGIEGDDGVTKADGNLKKGLTIRQGSDGQWNIFEDGLTGEKLYRELVQDKGSDRAASEYLKSIGIPGLRYLDGTSRGKGEGHHNYVVFDDAQIAIEQVFYQGLNAPKGASLFTQQHEAVIHFFESSDISTGGHEVYHVFRRVLEQMSLHPNAPAWMREDWGKACEFVGATPGTRWTREQEEQFALAGEKYLAEGQAPSVELRGVFAQFRTWLLNIYKTLLNMPVKISPEMRGVFDRMLATEQQVQEAAAKMDSAPMFEDAQVADEDRAAYVNAAREAKLAGEDEVIRKMDSQRKREMPAWRKEAEAAAADHPGQKMLAEIVAGGGLNIYELRDMGLAEADIERLRKLRPGGHLLTEGEGIKADALSEQYGFKSVPEMVTALLQAPSRAAITEAKLAEMESAWRETWDPEVSVLSERYEALLEMEAKILAKATKGTVIKGTAIRAMVNKLTGVTSLERISTSDIENLKSALRREAAAAKRAMREGKTEEAALAKDRQRRALAELKAKYEAKIEVAKINGQLKALLKQKGIRGEYYDQMVSLMNQMGLTVRKPSTDQLPNIKTFLETTHSAFDAEHNVGADGQPLASSGVVMASWIIEGNIPTTGQMTLDQLRAAHQSMAWLAHTGRTIGKLITKGKIIDAREVSEEFKTNVAGMKKVHRMTDREKKSFFGRVTSLRRGFLADLKMMEFLVKQADGFKKGVASIQGTLRDVLIQPIIDARSEEKRTWEGLQDKLSKIVVELPKDRFAIDEVKLSEDVRQAWEGLWDWEKVFMVGLNMGNPGNLKALMRGYAWTNEQGELVEWTQKDLLKITERLTPEMWDSIEEIWKLVDSIYPMVAATRQRESGVTLKKVQAVPFQNAQGRTLRGGYYPLIFDGQFSRKAARAEERDIMNSREAVFQSPDPRSGMTVERKGGTLPPKLALSTLYKHLWDSVHYATHAEACRDAWTLVNDDVFRTTWIDTFGQEAYDALTPWVRYIARPEREHADQFDSFLDRLRTKSTIVVLGLNLRSAVTQVNAIVNAMNDVGVWNTLKAAGYMLSERSAAYDKIDSWSTYMKHRSETMDADMKRVLMQRMPDGKFIQTPWGKVDMHDFHEFCFWSLKAVDGAMARVCWMAAYEKGLAEINAAGAVTDAQVAHAQAVQYADDVTRQTQGSSDPMDMAGWMRSDSGWKKMFGMFMTFTMRFANRQGYYIRGLREGKISGAEFGKHFFLEWVMPPLLSDIILAALVSGDVPDWEERPGELAADVLGNFVSGIPVLRNVLGAVKFAGNKITKTPALQGLDSAVDFSYRTFTGIHDVLNGEMDDKQFRRWARSFVETVGYGFGIPYNWAFTAWDGVNDWIEGDTSNPLRLVLKDPTRPRQKN